MTQHTHDRTTADGIAAVDLTGLEAGQVTIDIRGWSEASRVVLQDVVAALERLEAAGAAPDSGSRELARFRRSLFMVLRALRTRDESLAS